MHEKTTFSSLKVTFRVLKVIFSSLKVTFSRLKVTFSGRPDHEHQFVGIFKKRIVLIGTNFSNDNFKMNIYTPLFLRNELLFKKQITIIAIIYP